MHKIAENGIITLVAGDSMLTTLQITYTDNLGVEQVYKISESDTVYFSLMEPHQSFENGIVRKIYTKKNTDRLGNIIVHLTAEDTENLHTGTYYYEIKFTTKVNGTQYADTLVPKCKFFII